MVLLWDSERRSSRAEPRAIACRHHHDAEQVSRASQALTRCEALFITDAPDNRFPNATHHRTKLRSILVAPLMAEKSLGFLHPTRIRARACSARRIWKWRPPWRCWCQRAGMPAPPVRAAREGTHGSRCSARIVQDILPRTVPQLPGYVFVVKGSIRATWAATTTTYPMAGAGYSWSWAMSGHDIASALVASMARAVAQPVPSRIRPRENPPGHQRRGPATRQHVPHAIPGDPGTDTEVLTYSNAGHLSLPDPRTGRGSPKEGAIHSSHRMRYRSARPPRKNDL